MIQLLRGEVNPLWQSAKDPSWFTRKKFSAILELHVSKCLRFDGHAPCRYRKVKKKITLLLLLSFVIRLLLCQTPLCRHSVAVMAASPRRALIGPRDKDGGRETKPNVSRWSSPVEPRAAARDVAANTRLTQLSTSMLVVPLWLRTINEREGGEAALAAQWAQRESSFWRETTVTWRRDNDTHTRSPPTHMVGSNQQPADFERPWIHDMPQETPRTMYRGYQVSRSSKGKTGVFICMYSGDVHHSCRWLYGLSTGCFNWLGCECVRVGRCDHHLFCVAHQSFSDILYFCPDTVGWIDPAPPGVWST